jgi:hypothetical protein
MSTSNTRAKHVRSTVCKIVMALTFASVIGVISLVPALGKDNDRRQGHQERGWHQRQGHQERGWQGRRWQARRWQARQWQARQWQTRQRQDRRGWRVYQRYGYAAPVYVQPPVVYAPYRSPGISLVFPFYIP